MNRGATCTSSVGLGVVGASVTGAFTGEGMSCSGVFSFCGTAFGDFSFMGGGGAFFFAIFFSFSSALAEQINQYAL